MKRLIGLAVFCLSLLVPLAAGAQPTDADRLTARALAEEGQAALDKKDYETAADRFKRAEDIYHAPTLMLGLARAYVGLGKYVQARETYNKIIRERLSGDAPEEFREAVQLAESEIVGLDAKIAWVVIDIQGPDAPKVTIDGVDVPVAALGVKRAVNPGSHLVVAEAPGYSRGEASFDIVAGGSETIQLVLEAGADPGPPPPPPPVVSGGEDGSMLTILGGVAIGVGGAGLVVGAVTGGLAIGKHSYLEDNCTDGACSSDLEGDLDSYHTLGTVSTIGFIAGGLLAATGVVLIVIAPSGEEPGATPPVKAEIGAGSLSATFSW